MISLMDFRSFNISEETRKVQGGGSYITWKGKQEINGVYHNICDIFVEGLSGGLDSTGREICSVLDDY